MKTTVVAHPNSKRKRVEKDLDGIIHVYVNEPRQEGKANKAITELLCDYFHIKKSDVTLLSGKKSKIKVFDINVPPNSYKY